MSTARHWRITLPDHPLSPNRAAAASLRVRLRDKKHWRDGVAWEIKQVYQGEPLQHARVTVAFIRPDSQFYDNDNAHGACKRLVDGLVVGGILVDDAPEHIELTVTQKRGPRRCVEITIQEAA